MKGPTFCKQYAAEPKWWSFLTLRAEIVSSINWCFQFHFCPAPIQSTPRSHCHFWNTQQSNHIVFLLKTSQDWGLLGFFSGHEDLEKASGSSMSRKRLREIHVHGFEPIGRERKDILMTRHKTYLSQSLLPYTKYPACNKNYEAYKKATRNNILSEDKAINAAASRYDTDVGTTWKGI